MAGLNVNPTRMELKKLQPRYAPARRGHKLLKDKRDELMRQFLLAVREDKELRTRVEKALKGAYEGFALAGAAGDPRMLSEALILPRRGGELMVDTVNRMSVIVPTFRMRMTGAGESDSYNYGLVFTSGELDDSVRTFGTIATDLLRMAQLEKEAALLAAEIERTRRRVNALEYILMPRYLSGIREIKAKLEENERGNVTRLMKVKDMMLAAKLETERAASSAQTEEPEE